MKRTAALLILILTVGCSTTRVLQEGQYRLARNEISINGVSGLSANDLDDYIRQSPNSYFLFGWNPFLNIYNWGSKEPGADGLFKKIGTAPVVFDAPSVESSKRNIENHLEYLGYFNSTVEATVDTLRRLVKVKYSVFPGKRFIIDEIRYELPGNEQFRQEFRADSLNMLIGPGSYLSEKVLEAESARGASCFRNLGYYDLSRNNYFFNVDTLTSPGRTILTYAIREYTRNETQSNAVPLSKYRFGNISINYSKNIPFRTPVFNDMVTIHPGGIYSESSVNTTYQRLAALKVFNSVGVSVSPADSAVVDCSIKLSESKPKGFKVNLEASTNSSGLIGVSPQLSWYNKNVFHGGEWLTIGFNGNFQFKIDDDTRSTEVGANASLSLPKFLGVNTDMFTGPNIPRTEFKTAFNYQSRPEYTRSIFSFSYGYSGVAKDSKLIYQLYPLDLNYVRLTSIDRSFEKTLEGNPYLRYAYQDHLDAGLHSVLYYSNNTDIVPKTPYHFEKLSLDLSGNVLSLLNPILEEDVSGQNLFFNVPYAQYVRAEMDFGRAFRWGKRDGQALAMRFLCGAALAYGNSNAVPFEKQFYAGGASSMRGWQTRSLGPGYQKPNSSFSIPSQSGDFKLEADLEYRFAMFWKMEGALFAEAGNVWALHGEGSEAFSLGSLAADWGAGLRLNMNFILMRLDFGFKVHDPSRDKEHRWIGPSGWFTNEGFAFHFGVGYPF